MAPLSPVWVLACLAAALITTYGLRVAPPPSSGPSRHAAIDGLRGYLAFFVFVHHASIWYFYSHTQRWEAPASRLYTHLGDSSVALFFMITGFLFFSKLLDAHARPISWSRLFISRVMRLFPLYAFALMLVLLVVGVLSDWHMREPLHRLIAHVASWAYLTIPGRPPINGVDNTNTITAGVTWSLPYEWAFYFALPLLALLIGLRPSRRTLLTSLAVCGTAALVWEPRVFRLLPFLGGIAAAYAVRSPRFVPWAQSGAGAITAAACLVLSVTCFTSAYKAGPLLLLSLAFCIMAGGNTLFGLLSNRLSHTLGEMAYSIYLLHGIVLFAVFHFALSPAYSSTLSAPQHWAVVLGVTPLLLGLCHLTFRLIEMPGNRLVGPLHAWWRHLSARIQRTHAPVTFRR